MFYSIRLVFSDKISGNESNKHSKSLAILAKIVKKLYKKNELVSLFQTNKKDQTHFIRLNKYETLFNV